MFTKRLSMVIAAGVLLFGIAGLAQAEDKAKAIRSQEQVRITEQHEAQVMAGESAEKAPGGQVMAQDRTQDRLKDGTGDGVPDRTQDRLKDGTGDADPDRLLDKTQSRDRLKDGTGDGVPDQLRDHDRTHDRLGTGAGGTGGGMRGPRR